MTLRIGILGAAAIAPRALIKPAREVADVEVVAVAARDHDRAARFARRHHISRVHHNYGSLLGDPDVDAVYVPLPNGLHGCWTERAAVAGKHVLCEKPFAANRAEAAEVAAVCDASGRVVMEAFHWRYHDMAQAIIEVVASGELGTIEEVSVDLGFPLISGDDIRFDPALAGGALMDIGCYGVHMLRTVMATEPRVVGAEAQLRTADIDHTLVGELEFPGGVPARLRCSLRSRPRLSLEVVGDRGRLRARNPLAPQLHNRLLVESDGSRRSRRVRGESSYLRQLRVFAAAVQHGAPFPTTATDAVATMAVIDDLYRAAGLEPRQPTR